MKKQKAFQLEWAQFDTELRESYLIGGHKCQILQEMENSRVKVVTFTASLIGFLLLLLIADPGFMTTDSYIQLGQALSDTYTNWHPPLYAWIWNKLLHLGQGPRPLLFLQGLSFWGALAILSYQYFPQSKKKALFFIFSIGFFPAYFLHPALAWKDIGQGCAYLLGFALSLSQLRKNPSLSKSLLGFISLSFLFYGFSLRHNSLFSTLPLLIFWAANFVAVPSVDLAQFQPIRFFRISLSPGFNLKAAWTGGIGFLLCTGFYLGQQQIAKTLTAEPQKTGVYVLFLRDLTALSIDAGNSLLPKYIVDQHTDATDIENLKRIYAVGPDGVLDLGFPETAEHRTELKNAWTKAAIENPLLFLKHRLRVWTTMLGSGGPVNGLMIGQDRQDPNVPPWKPHWILGKIADLYLKFSRTFLFLPAIYLIPLVFLFLREIKYCAQVSTREISHPLERMTALGISVFTLGASGLLHSFGYLLAANAADFRYHWWTVLCSGILIVGSIGSYFLTQGRSVDGYKKR